MEREVIHQLLEKYYAGETTEHEETVLIDWFASERVPDGLRADRLLFEQVYGLSPLVAPGRGLFPFKAPVSGPGALHSRTL